MASSKKDRTTPSSGQENSGLSGRWQRVRQTLVQGDLLPGLSKSSKQDSDENLPAEERIDRQIKDAVRKGAKDLASVSEYRQNMQRQNELIAFAKPYRLNIVTGIDTLAGYQLLLEHPTHGDSVSRTLGRELVDDARQPGEVLKAAIADMKKEMLRLHPEGLSSLTPDMRAELGEYAKPFDLTVSTGYVNGTETVELFVRHDDYGASKVSLNMGIRSTKLSDCKKEIDEQKKSLGYVDLEKEEPKVAQYTKPFVLECPVHGGQMAHVTDKLHDDEYWKCLTPGCKKKARLKSRAPIKDFGALLAEGTQTTGSMGASDFLNAQGVYAVPPLGTQATSTATGQIHIDAKSIANQVQEAMLQNKYGAQWMKR